MSKFWPATSLTGGGFGALDKIDGDNLQDEDVAIVTTPGVTGVVYHYTLKADSGAAESSPDVIAPDSNPGTKRWILVEVFLGKINHLSFKTSPTGVPTVEGSMSWDLVTHMPIVKSDILASTMNLGLEDWVRIRNETGSTIADGAAVVGAGSVGGVFTVNLALAVPGPLAGITGIATSEILDGAEGWATTRGDVRSYDT